jgi:oxaloacetate decarboxylase beta subunit
MVFLHGGLVDYLYLGFKTGIYPSLIFLGIGAMTDFTSLIANPKTLLLGAAAQLGVFVAFLGSILLGFDLLEAAAIGIIGGADGPTAILVTKTLAPHLLGAIAIAAYSYMALIPIIQPPFMKLLTTDKERRVEIQTLRPVSKIEKVLFPIIVTFIVCMIVPDAAPLVGFLMLGNLFTVCGVTDRLSKTAQNELINIVTIMLGVSVGATANAENFLALDTVKIIILGLTAFCISTCGGLLGGKVMYNTKMTDFECSGGRVTAVVTDKGRLEAGALILAIGHSARDTYQMLLRKNVSIESKDFSVWKRAGSRWMWWKSSSTSSPARSGKFLSWCSFPRSAPK